MHPALLLLQLVVVGWLNAVCHGQLPPKDFDCAARKMALEQATSLLAHTPGTISNVHEALRLQECGVQKPPDIPHTRSHPELSSGTTDECVFYVSTTGSDSNNGSFSHPFASLTSGRNAARLVDTPCTIEVRAGRYYFASTLVLTPADSGLTIQAYHAEEVIISGGTPMDLVFQPASSSSRLLVADVAAGSEFTSLFLEPHGSGGPIEDDVRLIWAREPNGHPERDLQPSGYALVAGGPPQTWPSRENAVHVEVDDPKRNSSVYPFFGRDFDPRMGAFPGNGSTGWQWLHSNGTGVRFGDNRAFWNGTVPLSMFYNETGGDVGGYNVSGFSAENWTAAGLKNSRAHVFHPALWGNWVFDVVGVNVSGSSKVIQFNQTRPGGWQEGRGGGMRDQPFFVEGVREALDSPGEFWLDQQQNQLFLFPNISNSKAGENVSLRVVAPHLFTLVSLEGEEGNPVRDVSLSGLVFTHAQSSVMQPYEVPSPGDWSIHRGGALFAQGSEGMQIDQCRFFRVDGNGVFLSGHVWNSSITRSEFAFIGDSAIATAGTLSLNDGATVDTFPADTLIQSNHLHEIGLIGKQTSALFSALTCRTTFANNVAYNGPRAGININDGFCHGHNITRNVLFNWVRETQDHGPINTWDRACYSQKGPDGLPTTTKAWAHINSNFIMNGPSGNRNLGDMFPAIDNDDGSSFYHIARNFLVYGGGKNYFGNDKEWVDNVIAYPDRWSGDPCVQIWGGPNHFFVNNTCIIGVTNETTGLLQWSDPIGLDGTVAGFNCTVDFSNATLKPNIGFTETNNYFTSNGTWSFQCGNATSPDHSFTMSELQNSGWAQGSSAGNHSGLPLPRLLSLARAALGMPPGGGDQ